MCPINCGFTSVGLSHAISTSEVPNEMHSSPGPRPMPAKEAGLSPVKAVKKQTEVLNCTTFRAQRKEEQTWFDVRGLICEVKSSLLEDEPKVQKVQYSVLEQELQDQV